MQLLVGCDIPLTGQFEKCQTISTSIWNKAKDRDDIFDLQLTDIDLLFTESNPNWAVEAAVTTRWSLGEKLPRNPGNLYILFQLPKARRTLSGKSMSHLSNLPIMEDERMFKIGRLLSKIQRPLSSTATPC